MTENAKKIVVILANVHAMIHHAPVMAIAIKHGNVKIAIDAKIVANRAITLHVARIVVRNVTQSAVNQIVKKIGNARTVSDAKMKAITIVAHAEMAHSGMTHAKSYAVRIAYAPSVRISSQPTNAANVMSVVSAASIPTCVRIAAIA